ncbi:MAG: hypothetical protein JWL59_3759 [Chthoniobacteraceae bacterium]|nr:hypothetical protein [Chthoniobacteraceae bacterium]
MKFPLLIATMWLIASASAQQINLIPNSDFSDPVPLKGWRVDFPYQDWYVKNVTYVRQTTMDGKRCAVIELPAGIAGNEGGKIETALVPVVPGATYLAEVQSFLPDFGVKIHAEVYAVDPRNELVRKDVESKGVKITIMRIPEQDGHPALVQIYRAQFPDPPKGNKWSKTVREFTVPMEWKVGGQKVKPAYITIKAYSFEGTPNAGKSYFTSFKLFKIKEPGAVAAPQTGILR